MKDRNKNRLGYKKTKVGWIPLEWETPLLDRIAKRETGHTPNKKKPEFWNGPIKWVSLADSGKLNRPVIDQTAKTITAEGIRNSSARLLQPGTVILLRDASVGLSSVLGEEMAVSQHFVTWSCSDTLHNFFLYYWLLYNKRHFQKTAFGSTIVTIGMPFFKKMHVPLPPLPEQKKIAEILSTWDEAVEQTRNLIDAKKRRKKALMQKLLTGKKRLPGFNEPWKEYRLGDLFEERREINYANLMLLAITGSRGVIPASEVERKDSSNTDKSKYKRIAPGDIGYNTMRMWQGVSAVSDLEGIVSPAYTICAPKENVDVCFIGHFFKYPPIINLFRRFSQGLVSDTLNLKFKNFAQITVKMPNLDEQQAI